METNEDIVYGCVILLCARRLPCRGAGRHARGRGGAVDGSSPRRWVSFAAFLAGIIF